MSAVPEKVGDQVKNVLATTATPVDVRKSAVVGGSISHVFFEVMVSYIARYILKAQKRSVAELTFIHSLSIPLQGGLSAFTDPPSSIGMEAPMSSQFVDGAKGVPGVFAATYAANTFMDGLHLPRLDFTDILITAASKIITKPMTSVLYPYLGAYYRNGTDALNETFIRQHSQSSLNTEKSS